LSRKVKKPELGDRIEHREPAFNRTHEGVVIEMLAEQFVYKTDEGHERFCLFRELWTKVS
jgi:hypothetical protein|tara:strand:- start:642 stop:821 length:180 start_codon:yes stop_codon:yes gene_type:complete